MGKIPSAGGKFLKMGGAQRDPGRQFGDGQRLVQMAVDITAYFCDRVGVQRTGPVPLRSGLQQGAQELVNLRGKGKFIQRPSGFKAFYQVFYLLHGGMTACPGKRIPPRLDNLARHLRRICPIHVDPDKFQRSMSAVLMRAVTVDNGDVPRVCRPFFAIRTQGQAAG